MEKNYKKNFGEFSSKKIVKRDFEKDIDFVISQGLELFVDLDIPQDPKLFSNGNTIKQDSLDKISQENHDKLKNYKNLSFEEFLGLLCEYEIKNESYFPSQKVGMLLAFYLLKNGIYPKSYRVENTELIVEDNLGETIFDGEKAYVFENKNEGKNFFLPSFSTQQKNTFNPEKIKEYRKILKTGETATILAPFTTGNHFVLKLSNLSNDEEPNIKTIDSFNEDRFKDLSLKNPINLKEQDDNFTCGLHMINSLIYILTGEKEKCKEIEGAIERVKNKEILKLHSTEEEETKTQITAKLQEEKVAIDTPIAAATSIKSEIQKSTEINKSLSREKEISQTKSTQQEISKSETQQSAEIHREQEATQLSSTQQKQPETPTKQRISKSNSLPPLQRTIKSTLTSQKKLEEVQYSIKEPKIPQSEIKNLINNSLKKRIEKLKENYIFISKDENKLNNTFLSLFFKNVCKSVDNFCAIEINKNKSYNDYF